MSYLENKYFLIALTFVVYVAAQILQRRTGISFLNPILITITVLICILMSAGVDYDTYAEGGEYIDFWLKPAVVALGVPLYRQLEAIKKQLLPILLAELAGCVVGVVSVVVVAQLLGASKEVILSLAPKSVTTPIAMEIAQTVGGIPALTAAVVVCTGKEPYRARVVDGYGSTCRRDIGGNGCRLPLWRILFSRANIERTVHRASHPTHFKPPRILIKIGQSISGCPITFLKL